MSNRHNRQRAPIRILQVFDTMCRGGSQTWLMQVLRHIDRERFHMDFLVRTTQPDDYDDEIRALGSRIIPCLQHRRPWWYPRDFRRMLAQAGPYDIIHCHIRHFSGVVLRLAHQAGIPARIVHIHSDNALLYASAKGRRWLYLRLTNMWMRRYATLGLAVSSRAAAGTFGLAWQDDPRWRVLYCGVDLEPFARPVDAAAVRAELRIPPDGVVIGHVGRFFAEKNQRFLVDIALEVARRNQQVYLLLVGDGPARPEIEHYAARRGLINRVIFAGSRADVPRLLMGAMDLFVFPSLFEGLGLALVEAQAAGLPCICADVVPPEADVVPPLIRRLSLAQPAAVWAEAVLQQHDAAPMSRAAALACVRQSPFDLQRSIAELTRYYEASLPT